MKRWLLFVAFVLAPVGITAFSTGHVHGAPPATADAAGIEFYESKIRPLLANHCYKCHGPVKQEGGLRLDSIATILTGGDQGPALVAGKPDESRMIEGVRWTDRDFQMPPKGKLSDQEIADLVRWVALGGPAPKADVATNKPKQVFDLAERRKHWAFQGLAEAKPPVVAGEKLSPIDAYLDGPLRDAGLQANPPADKRTLLRRATFDLIGLPPTKAEIDAFLADDSPEAFTEVVDRLLDSPHFGERWARHWLDLVRYAETRGHEFDYLIPNAYQYRDYVIRALNADVPYNQFVTEHLAGDLLDQTRLNPANGANESILGTGFWFLGEEVHSPVDICADGMDRVDNKIDVMSKTFFGLTVACARCHDHKFDAISTKDYYALSGFLQSASYRQVAFEAIEHNRQVAAELESLRDKHRGEIFAAVAQRQRAWLARTTDYLLAARDAIRLGPLTDVLELASEQKPEDTAGNERRIRDLAEKRKLDAARLTIWVSQIQNAAKDPADPLHPWSLLVKADPQEVGDQLTKRLNPLVEKHRAERDAAAKLPTTYKVIVDYAALGKDQWFQDGLAFGRGPVAAGEVRLGTSPSQPIAQVFAHGGAQSDAAWSKFALAPGTEKESIRVGNWAQTDRTLRTANFSLGSGKLYYLVKGPGTVYAAVDSHRVNYGPLHGALVKQWKEDKLQWIEHNLEKYAGHRTHLEFTPGDSELAVLKVVEADSRPPLPPATNGLVVKLLEGPHLTLESIATRYEAALLDVTDRLAGDRLRESEWSADYAALANVVLKLVPPVSDDSADQNDFFAAQAALVAKIKSESHTAPALLEGSGVDQHVLIRGSHKTPGELVPRRFLEAISGSDQATIAGGSGRLELAQRLTDPNNPLFSRVIVNRLWHHLFGRGIVASVDNFGLMGEPPTNAALLDYLARQMIRQGYSQKKLLREIMLSRAYQMSSKPDERAVAADPQNRLLHHMPVRRLEGEVIRDAILAVSGQLDPKLYGPSIEVHLNEFMEGRGRPASGPLDGARRRSVYLKVRRNFLNGMFLAFDTPSPLGTVGRRSVSNVPAQALTLMNSPLVVEQTRLWSARMLKDSSLTPDARVTALYETAFTRLPTGEELQTGLDFVAAQSKSYEATASDPRAWADLCHVLLNVKEFIFIQ